MKFLRNAANSNQGTLPTATCAWYTPGLEWAFLTKPSQVLSEGQF